MHAGAAEGFQPEVLDSAKMAHIAGDKCIVMFDRSGSNQGITQLEAIARECFSMSASALKLMVSVTGREANFQGVHKIASDRQFTC